MKASETIGVEVLARITEQHIRRYEAMAERGGPNIRVGECRDLARVWRTTDHCQKEGLPLPDVCESELFDALSCGDYDEWLTPAELDRVQNHMT